MLQQRNQVFVHEIVVVGDAKDYDAFPPECGGIVPGELGSMGFLHRKDQVGPLDLVVREPDVGIAIESRGVSLQVGMVCENLLGSGAPESVFRAEEENAHPLFFEVEAEKFILSAHEEFSIAQCHGAPVAEILLVPGGGPKNIGFREEFELFCRWVDEAKDSVFTVLDDQSAISIETGTTSHEGVVTRAPEFFAFEIEADKSAFFSARRGFVVGIFVGEKVEMIVDDERRVNLGSFLGGP